MHCNVIFNKVIVEKMVAGEMEEYILRKLQIIWGINTKE
jgi:hypothetical protein